jgi:hypothetical protein
MPTLQDAADHLHSALQAELAYKQAVCTEPEQEGYQQARNVLLKHYVEEGAVWHEERVQSDDFRPNPALAERFRRRDLFQVKTLSHPDQGILAIGYAGETSTALPPPFSSGYKYLYLMQPQGDSWAICGHYTPCFACMSLGCSQAGETCAPCGGLGWEYLFGLDLKSWGSVTGTLKLVAPREPEPHQKEYEKD